jgi:dipeptide/tripeptide permease
LTNLLGVELWERRRLHALIIGLLQTRAGFHYGFGAAAVGIALRLA